MRRLASYVIDLQFSEGEQFDAAGPAAATAVAVERVWQRMRLETLRDESTAQ